jgi:hypothetical protein
MSGKPRYAGGRAVLEHFGVPEPEVRAREYGDRKQVMIVELIEAGRFHAYPDALRFVLEIKDGGLRIAAASSSKNANTFLKRIRLDEFAREEHLSYDFVRADEAEEAWRVSEPILDAWEQGLVPLLEYPAGSSGPGEVLLTAQQLGGESRRVPGV